MCSLSCGHVGPLYFDTLRADLSLSTNDTDEQRRVVIAHDAVSVSLDRNALVVDSHSGQHTLDLSNDAHFDQVILVSQPHRRRLWNEWDHSTSHHLKSGRFIIDPSKKRTFDDARSLCREYCACSVHCVRCILCVHVAL